MALVGKGVGSLCTLEHTRRFRICPKPSFSVISPGVIALGKSCAAKRCVGGGRPTV
jgi:hypothetical protein